MISHEQSRLIVFYFHLGLQQQEIRSFLSLRHGINVSVRHFKRILATLNLRRRKRFTNNNAVSQFIEHQLQGCSQLHGYRWMHLKCLQNGFVVTRQTVRQLLKQLDPEGVFLRTKRRLRRRQYYNKGPNYLWHIDGYDKLKPYGIAISGCIDGFSRHIIWLKACYTNNNPRIISGLFLTSIKTCGGSPRTVRTDMGTENCHIEYMQTFLRSRFFADRNSLPAFLYGTSQHNQRIECWWSILRKEHAQYWMNFFEILKEENYFNGTFVDKCLIQFCFLSIIQEELDSVTLEWNSHRITSSRHSRGPVGKPIIMYNLPELFGTKDYSVIVCSEEVTLLKEHSIIIDEDDICSDKNMYQLCKILMTENNYNKPEDVFQALEMYKNLRVKLYELF